MDQSSGKPDNDMGFGIIGDAQNTSGGSQSNNADPTPPPPLSNTSAVPIPPPPLSNTSADPIPPPSIFNDDEPLAVQPAATEITPNSGLEKIAIETFTEFPAVAASCSNPFFAVLLGIHAPTLPNVVADSENRRVPIDLVAVLDVSSSMSGQKLSLLKSATKFVIDHMLPSDRLSIVSFASEARRVLPLRRMTERGRKDAGYAVDLLRAYGCTDIVGGLNMGAQVLEQRRECNPVSSIIFLSDGQDTVNIIGYLRLLSSSISSCVDETSESRGQRFPVYTFGLGIDHDAVVMNTIADGSAGTYSFVESAEMIPTSFARCIGGLFSVVAQDVRVSVWSASPGVEIKSIPSGRHRNEIISQQKQGIIHVGDLFAEEKKEFLVYLSIPAHSGDDDQTVTRDETIISKTPLLDIVCYYRNAFTEEIVQIDGKSIEINRPVDLSPADKVVNLTVDRQRNRVEVAESIAKAKELADKGNLKAAKELLSNCNETLLASASAQSGVETVNWLQVELKEITARMRNMHVYDRHGRAFMLAGLSAHDAQRATTRNLTFMQDASTTRNHTFMQDASLAARNDYYKGLCDDDSDDSDDQMGCSLYDGDEYDCMAAGNAVGGASANHSYSSMGAGSVGYSSMAAGRVGYSSMAAGRVGYSSMALGDDSYSCMGAGSNNEEREEASAGISWGLGADECIAAGKACLGAYDTPFMIQMQNELLKSPDQDKKDDA